MSEKRPKSLVYCRYMFMIKLSLLVLLPVLLLVLLPVPLLVLLPVLLLVLLPALLLVLLPILLSNSALLNSVVVTFDTPCSCSFFLEMLFWFWLMLSSLQMFFQVFIEVLLVEVSSRDAVLVLVDAELSLDVLLGLFRGLDCREIQHFLHFAISQLVSCFLYFLLQIFYISNK